MGGRRIIDLSFEVYQGMVVYPSVAKPVIVELENHAQMARSMGTDAFGIDHLPNHCMIVTGDHVGTHLDSWGHVNPDAPRVEGIPLEYCYGDGVVLDLTSQRPGRGDLAGRPGGGPAADRLHPQAPGHRPPAHGRRDLPG